jgi:hypothetical protein
MLGFTFLSAGVIARFLFVIFKVIMADSLSNNLRTASPSIHPLILNGNFDKPQLGTGNYKHFEGCESVPPWRLVLGTTLVGQSSSFGYPSPYPQGSQCMMFRGKSSMYYKLMLVPDYNIRLTSTRSPEGANKININLHTSASDSFITSIYEFTPGIGVWQNYTATFRVAVKRSYRSYLFGRFEANRSSCLQAVSLVTAVASETNLVFVNITEKYLEHSI